MSLHSSKKIELDILIEIDRVCRENHIPYSLAWGTLIGAVRHKGFIPWDDDIDIMMERRYYDKFCKIVDGALGKNFVFVDYKRYEDYGLPFSKVAAKNTLMLEASSQYARIHHGVWVDIFPIDETSDDLKKGRSSMTVHRLSKVLCSARDITISDRLV